MPCPKCLGMGFTLPHSCPPYEQLVEEVEIIVPSGARAGQLITMSGKGNEIFVNGVPTKGDLQYVVEGITFDNHTDFDFDSNGVLQYTFKITPHEALHGFNASRPFLNGKGLTIRRPGKVTVPGSSIAMPGLGFPKFNASALSASVSESEPVPAPVEAIPQPEAAAAAAAGAANGEVGPGSNSTSTSSSSSSDSSHSSSGSEEQQQQDKGEEEEEPPPQAAPGQRDRTELFDDLVVQFRTYSEFELTMDFLDRWECLDEDGNKVEAHTSSSNVKHFGRGSVGGSCPLTMSALDGYHHAFGVYFGTCRNNLYAQQQQQLKKQRETEEEEKEEEATAGGEKKKRRAKKETAFSCAIKKTVELANLLRQNRVAESLVEELHFLNMYAGTGTDQ
jgi:hypothetical protein